MEGIKMHWTSEQPNCPGWWWFRYERNDIVIEAITEITQVGNSGKLFIWDDTPVELVWGEWSSESVPRPEECKEEK